MGKKLGTNIVFNTCDDAMLLVIIKNEDDKFTSDEIKFAKFEIDIRNKIKADVKNYSDEQLFNIIRDEKQKDNYSQYEIKMVTQEIYDRNVILKSKVVIPYSFLHFCSKFLNISAFCILWFTIVIYFFIIFGTGISFFYSLLFLVIGSSIACINYVCSKAILLLLDIENILKNKK